MSATRDMTEALEREGFVLESHNPKGAGSLVFRHPLCKTPLRVGISSDPRAIRNSVAAARRLIRQSTDTKKEPDTPSEQNDMPKSEPEVSPISTRDQQILRILSNFSDEAVQTILQYGVMQYQDDIRRRQASLQKELEDAKAMLKATEEILRS